MAGQHVDEDGLPHTRVVPTLFAVVLTEGADTLGDSPQTAMEKLLQAGLDKSIQDLQESELLATFPGKASMVARNLRRVETQLGRATMSQ